MKYCWWIWYITVIWQQNMWGASNISDISWWEQVAFWWDDDMSALCM